MNEQNQTSYTTSAFKDKDRTIVLNQKTKNPVKPDATTVVD